MALAEGKRVTGSDRGMSAVTESLKTEGAQIFDVQKRGNLGQAALVIYTEAIERTSNPEYLEAQEKEIECISYFEALGRLSAEKKTVAVIGTHGKTTTTAMLGQALIHADADPTVIVGTRVPAFSNKNIRIGKSDILVAEACEYRRSFMSLQPFGIVLLNCEADHLDYYKNEADYVHAFMELVSKLPEDGFLVFNKEDENAVKISGVYKGKKIGIDMTYAKELNLNLKVAGAFNVLNAAHAFSGAQELSTTALKHYSTKALRSGLENFSGTARRMEVKGSINDVTVIDDYGHHPTEIRVTLGAIRQKYPKQKIICVFQPHQYSRTHKLIEGFKTAFGDADMVIIPNIFEARDSKEDKALVSAESLVKAIGESHKDARWGENFEKTLQMVKDEAKGGDIVVTMGAGDVYKIGEEYIKP
jgi:UDP-N-acetylmuramate--alanine ligase